jgi:hypothetical protein
MATLDEILDTMPDEAEDVHEFLIIDAAARRILVPEAEAIFGVENDREAERKYFRGPRYVGDDLDLADMFLTVYFRNANGDEDGYLVDDVAVDGDDITFSWLLSEKVTAFPGEIQFAVCAARSKDGTDPDWNTTLASGTVLDGLHADPGDVEEQTSDVVTQLREEMAVQVQRVQDAGDAVEAQITAQTSVYANAIKGRLSGEIVRADDVSPVEHYPVVRVHGEGVDLTAVTVARCGKNLLQFKDDFTMNINSLDLRYDKETQVFTLNGTCNVSAPVNFQMGPQMAFKPFIADKAPMVLFAEYAGGSMVSEAENVGTYLYVTYINVGSAAVKLEAAQNVSKSFALAAGQLGSVWLHVKDTVTFTDYKFKVQIEQGDTATAFEPSRVVTALPDESGVAPDLPSAAPTMTLLTDTAGVTIECTYNRDSNAVLAEILEKIAALGGQK